MQYQVNWMYQSLEIGQKPHFRLFLHKLCDLCKINYAEDEYHCQIVKIIRHDQTMQYDVNLMGQPHYWPFLHI